MKAIMLSPVYLNVCNVRLFLNGLRRGRGPCFAIAALASVLMTGAIWADTHYVNATRPDDSGNGLTWATAEKTIQAAINASAAGDKIVVTNGIYAPISSANKPITLQSVNGEAVTIIDGGGTNRCATLGSLSAHTNTVLVGFTLRNGYASSGGGSYCGTLITCTLTGNNATYYGGGSYDGTLITCTLSGNNASNQGGGSYAGMLKTCALSRNSAYYDGGGSCASTLNNCTLTGNSASYGGGGSKDGTLNNCTLSGNSAAYGGGSYAGTLNTCTLSGNSASAQGGGSRFGTLLNCTLSGNTATSDGGGSSDGTLSNCTLTGNSASNGGGSHTGTRYNCTFSGNRATYGGGGAYNNTLNNCMLTGNSAVYGGGAYAGTLNNCTLSGNTISYLGGGSHSGTLNNCIVWGNTLVSGETNNYYGGTFRHSCTAPLASGTGNLSADPLFRLPVAGDYRLSPGSSCLNAGTNVYVVGSTDVIGNTRIQGVTVDMGAYEGPGTLLTDSTHLARNVLATGDTNGIVVSWNPPSAGGAVLYRVYRMDLATGRWTPVSAWIAGISFLDTQVLSGQIYRYVIVSAFDTRLDVISGLSAPAEGQRTLIPQYYVDASRPSDAGDGKSWATAKRTIQAAIDISIPYDTILVTNGLYAPISTANKAMTIQSVNGAAFTIIDGGRTTRCATLGSSSAHTNTVLAGFTLRNGYTSAEGGGSVYGTLNTCTLSGNSSSTSGGGSYYGTLNNCTLSGNTASSGGGSSYGTLNNCTLSRNSASSGGGSSYGTLNNCIVWGNTLVSGETNNYSGGTFSYSCTAPLPSGTGNRSSDPLFRLPAAGDFRLSLGSSCLNTGTNGYAVGLVDGVGNTRIQDGTVDMGAYEGTGTLLTDGSHLARNILATGNTNGVVVSWDPPSSGGAVLYRVCRMDGATGQWAPVSDWIDGVSFFDTQLFGGVSCRYAIVSAFDARLDVISGLSVTAEGQRTLPQLYVDATRPDDSGDGRSWATAKRTLQAAINVSAHYDTILVTNGIYAPISTDNKTIKILSVNGANFTIIDGGGTIRCATLGSVSTHINTILIGFTLRNGYANSGGGSYCGTLHNCTISGNRAYDQGGGSFEGTLYNCTLSGNKVFYYGGGSCSGTLYNCTLSGNSASFDGGGSYYSTLYNCTLTGNSASYFGGGSVYGTLNSCTLSKNNAPRGGGGLYGSTLNNSIVWGNTLFSGATNNYIEAAFNYSCTMPLPPGTGNLSTDPLFRLPAAGDFRLSPGSPCLNTGSNGYAAGTMDGLGYSRIQEGTVDMGAYEGAWPLATDATSLAQNVSAVGGADGITVSWQPPASGGALLYRVCRMDMVTGEWTPVSDWIDGLSFLDTQVFGGVPYLYAIVSAFDARLDVISGLSATAEGQRNLPQFYVDASRPDDAGDGRSWATAKQRIQAAISVAIPYDTILVTNGVYAPISTANSPIKILSVNGATGTVIDGGGTTRCATLGSAPTHVNTLLVGFTLRKGSAYEGGGSCYGTLNACTLSENIASTGGGSYNGTLNNCTLTGNRAFSYGGGSYAGTLNNCTLSGNSAYNGGGGAWYGTMNNCIVWGNTLVSGETDNYSNTTFGYSCTTPLPSGTGNISSDPLFKDSINSHFMLRVGSPCINAGANPFVVGATDLAGNPRIVAGTVDMGAYEMPPRVTVTFDANSGLLATGQTSTNFVGYTGDLYASWLTLSNGISRTGYSFAGWWTEPAGAGTQVSGDTTITLTTDHTLYAAWTANTYILTLDATGGNVSPASISVTFDAAYGDLPVPTRPGYTFGGWWTGDSGTGTQVTSATPVSIAGDHTLYAKWAEDPYLCKPEATAPLSSAGYYEGFFHSKSDFDGTPVSAVRGTLSLTLSALTGKLTAKVVMNSGSLRFSQSAWASPAPDDEGVCRAVLTGLGSEVLDLYVSQDRIWGTLSGGSLGDEVFTLEGARNRFSDRADPVAQALLDTFRGYYTVALPVYDALSLGATEAAPKGTGYLTLTVGDHGNVRISGSLADGTKISQSSHLNVFDGCGPEACVPLFVPLYGRTGWVGGLLWLDPVSRTIVTDRDLGWFVRWENKGSGPDGFSELLDACGGFYSTTESLAAHYRFSAQTNAVPYVHPRGIEPVEPVFPSDIAVTVDGTRLTMTGGVKPLLVGDVYDYAASENPTMATLTFQPATGIFKGRFKLYYDYTLNVTVRQHKIVSVPYSGVLAPVRATSFDGLPAGQGYYLVPDYTPAVAPYRLKRSYLIELDDAR